MRMRLCIHTLCACTGRALTAGSSSRCAGICDSEICWGARKPPCCIMLHTLIVDRASTRALDHRWVGRADAELCEVDLAVAIQVQTLENLSQHRQPFGRHGALPTLQSRLLQRRPWRLGSTRAAPHGDWKSVAKVAAGPHSLASSWLVTDLLRS